MRFHQPLLVLGLVALLTALGIGFVAIRSANAHRDGMLAALRHGLERACDQAIARTPTPNPEQSLSLPASALRAVLLDAKEPRAILPTFVRAQDVFLPRGSVSIPSDDLVCVVRVGNERFCGITGRRAWREVSRSELGSWPHDLLATNAPATQ